MAEYRDHQGALEALGVDLAALSVDDPPRSEAVRQQLGLAFPILCDSRREVVEAWDLYNRAEMGGIAYPAVFVIDRDRTVLCRSLDTTQARVSADGVLAVLRARAARTPPPTPARVQVGFPGVGFAARAVANMVRRGRRTPVG